MATHPRQAPLRIPVMTSHHPPTAARVLVLAGGKPNSTAPSRPWHLSNLRMMWLARSLQTRLAGSGVVVERVRYGVRGWNEPAQDPVHDAQSALDRLTLAFGDEPVILIGHSMGGRVAAHVAAHRNVRAVAALAPWWPESDAQLIPADRRLFVAHGERDRWTDPQASREQTAQARRRGLDATWVALAGGGHFMLTKPGWWHRVAAELVLAAVADLAQAESTAPAHEAEHCHD